MSFDSETRDHRRIQRYHAIETCRKRYGIVLNHTSYALICDRLWAHIHGSGDGEVERVGPRSKQRYYVTFSGTLMLVAWSDVTLQVATFLPRWCDMSEREDGLERTKRWFAAKV